jgi:hypothetical protein
MGISKNKKERKKTNKWKKLKNGGAKFVFFILGHILEKIGI